jgi:RNA polymerase sigma factor (sigma-70 family)
MAIHPVNEVVQHLRRSVILSEENERDDGELLESYLSQREELALELLVRRHGPMVWGVCQRMLHNPQDAEDAFQTTFLVLVRKAQSIHPRAMVANWLYGVAHQTALKARSMISKRKLRETQVTEMPEPILSEPESWHDLQPILDNELSRLPNDYRVVLILCDLEGQSRKEVAQLLGVPEGTVASRLARARTILAKRFARRGIVLSTSLVTTTLSSGMASVPLPSSVLTSTIEISTLFASGQSIKGILSPSVTVLMNGVMKAMIVTKIKTISILLLAIGLTTGVTSVGFEAIKKSNAGESSQIVQNVSLQQLNSTFSEQAKVGEDDTKKTKDKEDKKAEGEKEREGNLGKDDTKKAKEKEGKKVEGKAGTKISLTDDQTGITFEYEKDVLSAINPQKKLLWKHQLQPVKSDTISLVIQQDTVEINLAPGKGIIFDIKSGRMLSSAK